MKINNEPPAFFPDYNGNSIVNFTSSIRAIFGSEYLYPLLIDFNLEPFKGKNIVLIIIDGLGYDFLMEYGDNSFLKKYTLRKMTSVFPSSTAAAYISLVTGVAPQQHGLTGWFMFLKETGILTSILPFITKAGGIPLNNIPFTDIYDHDSIFSGLNAASFCIMHESFVNSQCSAVITKGAKRKSYADIKGFVRRIENIISFGDNKKFIFAYWDQLDKISHEKGVKSPEAFEHIRILNEEIEKLAVSLARSNTALIITSDHGMLDSADHTVKIEDHPHLYETLSMPLSGEPRVSYCYVRPGKVSVFERYVSEKLSEYCDLYKSPDLIEKGFFGMFEANKRLYQRTGDYTLIMKENYIIRETLSGQKYNELIGIHGGLTSEEMFVPLIIP
jgi:predicted AlkP superfamily pyrophosphatase or phosphodiesterase